MNTINIENCEYLIIDIQDKLVKMLEGSEIKENCIKLAKAANILEIPVIITEQYPKGLGSTIKEIKENIKGAKYVEKTSFSAYEEVKQYIKRKQIIIFGIETHICVLQTAFELIKNGYEIFVVENCCASRTNENKEAALKRLYQAGAQIVTLEMVIFELLKSSKHPNFKDIQALIK